MLACFPCQNLEHFVQVSNRGDARDVMQTASQGVVPQAFDRPDERDPGLYCMKCGGPLAGDLEALRLVDDRIDFLQPGDFRAEPIEQELRALRQDADWLRLEIPAQEPTFGDLPPSLAPQLRGALERTGRSMVYSHQSEAIRLALDGRNVIQATPAGSGKSLGLVLPALHRLLTDPQSTALLIYPLRALANDQLNALSRLGLDQDPWVDEASLDLRLADDLPPLRVSRFDGSTKEHLRASIRRESRLIIATPDILHMSMLRKGYGQYRDRTSWRRFLSGLSIVVLDEIHTYQGVFGSNVAHVLRRLRRTVARSGQRPQFLTASATVGNPVQLAERLTGVQPFDLVDADGSGRSRRVILVCNPPVRGTTAATAAQDTKKGRTAAHEGEQGGASIPAPATEVTDAAGVAGPETGRIAPQTIAIDVIGTALTSEDHLPVRTIAFARSRNAVFQLAQRVRGNLKERKRGDLIDAVAPYAATFLADDRVDAEGKLRDGSTLAVVSTSALELGIDIPDLSLAVLVGYPGQISSFRQRAGRVGRSGEGLAVLIVGDDPLQQWLARDRTALDQLLGAQAEEIVINPDAPEIARRFGLGPAQQEMGGISFEDEEFFGPIVHEWLAPVEGPPNAEIAGHPYWLVPDAPEGEDAYQNLRSASGGDSVSVYRTTKREKQLIGTIDRGSAPRDCFVPAIWSGPNGDVFEVVGFDEKLGEVYCEGPLDKPYLTRGVSVDQVSLREDHLPPRALGEAAIRYGVLEINRMVWSYKEQHFSGLERSKEVEKRWSPVDFVTDGLYVQVPAQWIPAGVDRDGSIRAAEHALLAVAPAIVACDPNDFDATSDRDGVFLYDAFGGGLRMSSGLYERFEDLVRLAYEVVATCPCDAGCPSCVMLSRRPDGNANLSKRGSLAILEALVATFSSPRTVERDLPDPVRDDLAGCEDDMRQGR